MGGLGPGIGGSEIIVIGLVALLVVGPKDLPLLMRRVGQAVAKARAMANDFRASFDEMARQSELDDLRKEVEALRSGQGMLPLGAEAENAFREIKTDLGQPLLPADTPSPTPPAQTDSAPEPVVTGVSEWPDAASPTSAGKPRAPRPRTAKPKAAKARTPTAARKPAVATEPAPLKPAAVAKPATRKPAVRKPPTRKPAK